MLYYVLLWYIVGNPYTITKQMITLSKLKLVSKGTLGFIVGFVHKDLSRPFYGDFDGSLEHEHIFNVSIDSTTGIKTLRFKTQPTLLLLKIRDCKRVLVSGYPAGVVGIPSLSHTVKIKLPHANTKKNMRISQFWMIPANAMTPEKLQGKI